MAPSRGSTRCDIIIKSCWVKLLYCIFRLMVSFDHELISPEHLKWTRSVCWLISTPEVWISFSDPLIVIIFKYLTRSAWSPYRSSWESCKRFSIMCLVMRWGAKWRTDQRYCPSLVLFFVFFKALNNWLTPEEILSLFYVVRLLKWLCDEKPCWGMRLVIS